MTMSTCDIHTSDLDSNIVWLQFIYQSILEQNVNRAYSTASFWFRVSTAIIWILYAYDNQSIAHCDDLLFICRTLIQPSTTYTGPALSATLWAKMNWPPWYRCWWRTCSAPPCCQTYYVDVRWRHPEWLVLTHCLHPTPVSTQKAGFFVALVWSSGTFLHVF